MQEELNQFERNKVWELVARLSNKQTKALEGFLETNYMRVE